MPSVVDTAPPLDLLRYGRDILHDNPKRKFRLEPFAVICVRLCKVLAGPYRKVDEDVAVASLVQVLHEAEWRRNAIIGNNRLIRWRSSGDCEPEDGEQLTWLAQSIRFTALENGKQLYTQHQCTGMNQRAFAYAIVEACMELQRDYRWRGPDAPKGVSLVGTDR